MGRRVIQLDYKPRAEQKQIHEALNNYRFCVTVAHRRMGKTVASIQELIKKLLNANYKDQDMLILHQPMHKQKELPGII